MPKKSIVFIVIQNMLNGMARQSRINKGFVACDAIKLISLNSPTLKPETKRFGLDYGLLKAIRLEDSPSFLAIAHSRSNKSKTIGSINRQSKASICRAFNTSSMTVLTLTTTTVSSPSCMP